MGARLTRISITADDIEKLYDLADLRPSQKQVVSMSLTATYKTIAETLNLPIGTVKSRINRARFRLLQAKTASAS